MYEYNKQWGALGSMVPVATARNIGPYSRVAGPWKGGPWRGGPWQSKSLRGMGWTGGFTIPGNEQRFSVQTCSGSAAVPMDSSSDLICGRSAEINYLNSIGCVPVGFQGSHHCLTDYGNQGVFYCCPPGILDAELARAGGAVAEPAPTPSALPSGILLGVGALAAIGVGVFLWDRWKTKQAMEEAFGYEY